MTTHRLHPCPRCGRPSKRHSICRRTVRDIGGPVEVVSTRYYCEGCQKHFSVCESGIAPPGSSYSHRAIRMAVRYVLRDGMTLYAATRKMARDHRVRVPPTTLYDWVTAEVNAA